MMKLNFFRQQMEEISRKNEKFIGNQNKNKFQNKELRGESPIRKTSNNQPNNSNSGQISKINNSSIPSTPANKNITNKSSRNVSIVPINNNTLNVEISQLNNNNQNGVHRKLERSNSNSFLNKNAQLYQQMVIIFFLYVSLIPEDFSFIESQIKAKIDFM